MEPSRAEETPFNALYLPAIVAKGMAITTLKSYLGSWIGYARWCLHVNQTDPFVPSTQGLRFYFVHLLNTANSLATLATARSALSYIFQLMGVPTRC